MTSETTSSVSDGNATSKPDSSKSTAPGEEGMPILVDGPGPATFGGKTQQELALAQAQSSDSMNAADEWERNYNNFSTGGNAFEQMLKPKSKPDGDTSMGGARANFRGANQCHAGCHWSKWSLSGRISLHQ